MKRRCKGGVIVIAAVLDWQAALYESLITPTIMGEAAESITFFAQHRATLQASGEAAATAGATTQLRFGALKLAGVAASTARALQRKVRTLAAYRDVWAGQPLAVAMVEAAVRADAAVLALQPAGQDQLLRTLRGQA